MAAKLEISILLGICIAFVNGKIGFKYIIAYLLKLSIFYKES